MLKQRSYVERMKLMKRSTYEENLIVKVAWHYYKNNLTQNEIAELLDLSRNKIVRMLEKARSDGIVQFNIRGNGINCLSTERDVIETFGLSDAFIIPTPASNLSDSLAKAAAQYLESTLTSEQLLGIGWGEAVTRTLQHLSLDPAANVSIVTLTGGVNYYFQKKNYSLDGGLSKFQGGFHIIPAPFLASSQQMASSILSEPAVSDILELAGVSSVMLVGIGGLSSDATIIKEEKITLKEMTTIKKQNGVGDILGQFYNAAGELLTLPHHERRIGIPISKLKGMKNAVGVAGGQTKIDAIYGALKGGYVQTLITDEESAIQLMQKEATKKEWMPS